MKTIEKIMFTAIASILLVLFLLFMPSKLTWKGKWILGGSSVLMASLASFSIDIVPLWEISGLLIMLLLLLSYILANRLGPMLFVSDSNGIEQGTDFLYENPKKESRKLFVGTKKEESQLADITPPLDQLEWSAEADIELAEEKGSALLDAEEEGTAEPIETHEEKAEADYILPEIEEEYLPVFSGPEDKGTLLEGNLQEHSASQAEPHPEKLEEIDESTYGLPEAKEEYLPILSDPEDEVALLEGNLQEHSAGQAEPHPGGQEKREESIDESEVEMFISPLEELLAEMDGPSEIESHTLIDTENGVSEWKELRGPIVESASEIEEISIDLPVLHDGEVGLSFEESLTGEQEEDVSVPSGELDSFHLDSMMDLEADVPLVMAEELHSRSLEETAWQKRMLKTFLEQIEWTVANKSSLEAEKLIKAYMDKYTYKSAYYLFSKELMGLYIRSKQLDKLEEALAEMKVELSAYPLLMEQLQYTKQQLIDSSN
ncbi:hypothetical protein [Bacillus sp. 1P06AnD]|uniref:hypothetical protein n=1 Tax=Bacillus sp. 1P06AnD TaxID=3132208 RepID=UPI0039A15244